MLKLLSLLPHIWVVMNLLGKVELCTAILVIVCKKEGKSIGIEVATSYNMEEDEELMRQ